VCFRPLGQPVTFTSAGVTMDQQPGGSQPLPHPAMWELRITLPTAEAAELATITTRVAGTQDQLAIIVAGQTWGMPVTGQPLTTGQFVILLHSRNEALQLQRILLKPA
jgi:preprotein translocase subunit SecD